MSVSDIWNLQGTPAQNEIIHQAIHRCTFPFDLLKPGLAHEGKTSISVSWEDLSRARQSDIPPIASVQGSASARAHTGGVHGVERMVDGRMRTLGLFYLPPHTEVVLDVFLENEPELAAEVFLAEAAHAVDYHYMTPEMRRLVTNTLHWEDLPPGADTSDGVAFHLDNHECSWFDVGPYEDWVGEAFMEAFTEAFSDIPTTMSLSHPTGPAQAMLVQSILLPLSPSEAPVIDAPSNRVSEVEGRFIVDLDRFLDTRSVPKYLSKSAQAWLDEKGHTT